MREGQTEPGDPTLIQPGAPLAKGKRPKFENDTQRFGPQRHLHRGGSPDGSAHSLNNQVSSINSWIRARHKLLSLSGDRHKEGNNSKRVQQASWVRLLLIIIINTSSFQHQQATLQQPLPEQGSPSPSQPITQFPPLWVDAHAELGIGQHRAAGRSLARQRVKPTRDQ
ncbi:hypothetical protein FQN50_003354 [Emmonsiellopsis sp. PD_5]|nr:hypothetical protein FQN50_003354 [Emmonsiellopsis sp. PD_5]